MNVSLSKKWDDFVKQQVHNGNFTSSSEVVRAALRLLECDINRHVNEIEKFDRYLERLAATDKSEFLNISVGDIIAQEKKKVGLA